MITVYLEEKNEENDWETEQEKQLADDCCSTEPHPPVRICEKRRIVHMTTTFAFRINLVSLYPSTIRKWQTKASFAEPGLIQHPIKDQHDDDIE